VATKTEIVRPFVGDGKLYQFKGERQTYPTPPRYPLFWKEIEGMFLRSRARGNDPTLIVWESREAQFGEPEATDPA